MHLSPFNLLWLLFSLCSRWEARKKKNIYFTPVWMLFVFVTYLFLSFHFSCTLQEEDFQQMVRAAQMMENQYGHLFEKVIVNDDLSVTFSELLLTLKKVETETHWVPVSWTHSWDPNTLWTEKRKGFWKLCRCFIILWLVRAMEVNVDLLQACRTITAPAFIPAYQLLCQLGLSLVCLYHYKPKGWTTYMHITIKKHNL